MGFASPANNWMIGVAKQAAEGTISTTATYQFPVFSGRPQPVQSINRVEVTDAAAIIGDPYKVGDEHWEADLVVPGFSNVLGTFLSMLWPTDGTAGSGTVTHTFTGIGSTPSWFAMYSDPLSGALDEVYEAGVCSGLTFSSDATGGPLRVGVRMVGKRPTVATWSASTTCALTDGYFIASGAAIKYEVDNATPATETNVQDIAISVAREATPIPTADSTSVALVNLGRVTPDFTMTLVYDDWDAYRATFYGAAAGTAPSSTIVKGSLEMNWVHSSNSGYSFKIEIPSAVFAAAPPQPDPGGAALTVSIAGYATKPGSGEHVEPTLVNGVTAAY